MAYKNFFRLKAADFIEDDGDFLRLFGADALDIFDPEDMWGSMQVLRSPRGGGKTSVMRIFSPGSLNEIRGNTADDLKPLRQKLQELGALSDDDGIRVLGVLVSLSGSYDVIEHLGLDESARDRLFFALLTCKIMIAALRSVCDLKRAGFPDGLERTRVERPSNPNIRACIPVPCDGLTLYRWAEALEGRIYDMLEGQQGSHKDLGGHETLAPIHIIKACNLYYDGEPVAERTLLMLDNADDFTSSQRAKLGKTLACLRMPGMVVAERLESLRPEELLSPNGTQGREYKAPLSIGRFWRHKTHRSNFKRLLGSISDRRVDADPRYNKGFQGMLESQLGREWDTQFDLAAKRGLQRIRERFGSTDKYGGWIDVCERLGGILQYFLLSFWGYGPGRAQCNRILHLVEEIAREIQKLVHVVRGKPC